jgi:hypothetical protein
VDLLERHVRELTALYIKCSHSKEIYLGVGKFRKQNVCMKRLMDIFS